MNRLPRPFIIYHTDYINKQVGPLHCPDELILNNGNDIFSTANLIQGQIEDWIFETLP